MSQKHDDKNNKSNLKSAQCIIVETKGSTPRKVGAKMRVWVDGTIKGTIGGGNLEKKVIQNAIEVINNEEPKLFKHDLLHQHSMCCGGTVQIYIEPIMEKKKLFVFGAGHTGSALAEYASSTGFEVFIIDDRHDYISKIDSAVANKMEIEYNKALPSLPFDDDSYIAIMTYEHDIDRDILSYCIKQPHAYLGMIGSKRKIELTKKMFSEGKIASKEELDKVDMPMGVKINAEGPNEIAISILAKLIEVKND